MGIGDPEIGLCTHVFCKTRRQIYVVIKDQHTSILVSFSGTPIPQQHRPMCSCHVLVILLQARPRVISGSHEPELMAWPPPQGSPCLILAPEQTHHTTTNSHTLYLAKRDNTLKALLWQECMSPQGGAVTYASLVLSQTTAEKADKSRVQVRTSWYTA